MTALSFLLVLGACTSNTDSSVPQQDEPLQLSVNNDTTIAGTFVWGSSVIEFRSESPDQRSAELWLNVNGADLTISLNLDSGDFDQDGYLNALTKEDLAALLALRDEFQAMYGDLVLETLQGKLLARHADHMAEAPTGHTLDYRHLNIFATLNDRHPNHGSCGNDGTHCLCDGCGKRWGYARYDDADGTYCYWDYTTYGEDAHRCRGRCGSGCNHWFDDDYMQDCLDHDQCGYHGGLDCGDEWDDAVGDYAVTYVAYC